MQELIDIRTLPQHTRKEVIFGKIVACINGRSEGFTVKTNLDYPRRGYLVGTGLCGLTLGLSQVNDSQNTSSQKRLGVLAMKSDIAQLI